MSILGEVEGGRWDKRWERDRWPFENVESIILHLRGEDAPERSERKDVQGIGLCELYMTWR